MTELGNILLADDDPRDIELTLDVLAESHFANKVTVTRDGAEALDYLFGRGQFATCPMSKPVLVILDMKMPKTNGLEVLQQMRANMQLKEVPVVLLTSARKASEYTKSSFLGGNVYLVKPLNVNELVDAAVELGLYWGITDKPPDEGNGKGSNSTRTL